MVSLVSASMGIPPSEAFDESKHSSASGGSGARARHKRQTPRTSNEISLRDAETVLGVTSSDDKATVKRAYRRLMSQHHPDKLIAKGLPEEMIDLATDKTQNIRRAYDKVKQARGWA